MPVHDELGKRMKSYYEQIPKIKLMRRTPVIIRLDGKAFHTFTKGFKKPFDEVLIKAMQKTTKYLCENIQGCVFGYTQSDEITLVLVDYKKLNSEAWFDYEVQKMCSIAASTASIAFNRFFWEEVNYYCVDNYINCAGVEDVLSVYKTLDRLKETDPVLVSYIECESALFDARCFNIPKEEVVNCVYWRQIDATRNSIQMVGQANFSHNELHKKTCNMIQEMLHEQKGINWNDYPTYLKRGSAVKKNESGSWEIDLDMPQLKGAGRDYLDKLIMVGE